MIYYTVASLMETLDKIGDKTTIVVINDADTGWWLKLKTVTSCTEPKAVILAGNYGEEL